jgi:hypothetical protein
MNLKSTTLKSPLETHDPDSPPLLKSWWSLYAFVLSELAILILLFYVFSKFYQ